MTCRAIEPLLGPFIDGEIGTERVLEVQQHLAECRLCVERVRLDRAMRHSVRQVVRPNALPSAAFQARLTAALEAAHQREWEARVVEREAQRGRMLSWRTILPVAAAAGFTLVWAASAGEPQKADRMAGSYAGAAELNSIDQLLEELVNHHVRGQPQVTEPTLLPAFEREVGVPVRIPDLMQYGARWEGGSVIPVSNQRAASLRYKLGSQRFTLYVYDSSRIPIGQRLTQRSVRDETVYVGWRRGYSIGATEHRGVGYAIASDLNDAETAEIVAALY